MAPLKRTFAEAAGGTLGFISGDLPGAYIGKSLASKAYDYTHPKMAKRKVGNKKKSKQGKRVVSSRKRIAKGVRRINKRARVSDQNDYAAPYSRSGSKVASKKGGKRRVRVGKRFRKAVKQVMEDYSPSGYYSEHYYNRYQPFDFNQSPYDLGTGFLVGEAGTSTDATGVAATFFDPIKVMDAASVLFNGKAPAGNKNLTNAGQFDYHNFTVDVVKQWVKMEFKNLTSRRLEVKLFSWELKSVKDIKTGFLDEWTFEMAKDASATDGNLNVLGLTPTNYGINPGLSPGMRQKFKIEETLIQLEPGKSYVHTVQGPAKRYDMNKFYDTGTAGGNFSMWQKGVKGVCMALSTDIIATSTGTNNTQRYTDIGPAQPFGLLVETTYNYVIRLPDQTGFKVTAAAGAQQALPKRRGNPYCVLNWDQVAQSGTVVEMEDENPLVRATEGG